MASANQATFLLYSAALMMKKMKNLINFLLRLQQSKQKVYEIIALFTQLCEVWNKCVFIATNRFCLIRRNYTPTRHHYHVIFFSDVISHHVTSRTIQFLRRCLETKDPVCHLGHEWRHTFQAFHTFHRVPKVCLNRWFSSTSKILGTPFNQRRSLSNIYLFWFR